MEDGVRFRSSDQTDRLKRRKLVCLSSKETDHGTGTYPRSSQIQPRAVEQGQAGRSEATSAAEPRLVDQNEAADRRHLGIEVDDAIEIAEKIDI